LISKPMPQTIADSPRPAVQQYRFGARLTVLLAALIVIGWLWPYQLSNLPSYLNSTGWMLGWFTVVVLVGAASGYVLRTRWSALVVPLGLYVGGVIHWLQFEWGFHTPPWPTFLLVSGLALSILFITGGASAGIAARVVAVESQGLEPSEGIRLSAAFAALLGLMAITTVYVLPMPFLGAMLGLGALLAGVGLMEEDQVNGRERLLAIAGMLVGVVTIGTQLYALWALVRDL
jgi:hypothetical protein